MIFSNSEREYYRSELEAASKAGDTKRVKRLIGQIRLLGDIREPVSKVQKMVLSPINIKGIQEYIKQQKALDWKSKLSKYPDLENDVIAIGHLPEVLDVFGVFKGEDQEDVLEFGDVVGFPFSPEALIDQPEMSFRDVLRLDFRDNGWTW